MLMIHKYARNMKTQKVYKIIFSINGYPNISWTNIKSVRYCIFDPRPLVDLILTRINGLKIDQNRECPFN